MSIEVITSPIPRSFPALSPSFSPMTSQNCLRRFFSIIVLQSHTYVQEIELRGVLRQRLYRLVVATYYANDIVRLGK